MTGQFDYYAILGVTQNASEDEIREAFIKFRTIIPQKDQNPDLNPEYKRILNAFEVLSDSQRRSIYDSLLIETNEATLDINIQISRKQVPLTTSQQLLYLLVDINPPSYKSQQLPLNLTLVIDKSTSMKGARLKNVKKAVELIVNKLSASDLLSIVSFSDRADVVVPSGLVNNKININSRIRSILASGGTEIYQGLYAGYKEMIQHELNDYTNHLILLTDGHTYGDAEKCLQLAEQAAVKGIGFSAFGIGSEWNDKFLDQLVAPSSGQSGFIETPESVIEFLQKKISGLGQIYAKNSYIENQFPASIKVESAFKLQPFSQPLDVSDKKIKLGHIEERSPLSILFEIQIDPQPFETRVNIPISVNARIPSEHNQLRTIKQQVQFMIVGEPKEEKPPEKIVKAVRSLSMYRLNEKVQEEVEAGDVEMATTRMRYLSTRLLQAGEDQLAHQAHMEAERLTNIGSLSSEGQKRLKYGTRALMNYTAPVEDSKVEDSNDHV